MAEIRLPVRDGFLVAAQVVQRVGQVVVSAGIVRVGRQRPAERYAPPMK
jgi:hypothetical protein